MREIALLDPRRFCEAESLLARAFMHYPVQVEAMPDPARRLRGNRTLYGAIVRDALRHGEVHADPQDRAIACWLGPGKAPPTLWRHVRSGMALLPLTCGWHGFWRLNTCDQVNVELHHRHAPAPHWFLSVVGVAPEHQGQGVGGALLRPMLERISAARQSAYLETHDERNVPIYQRLGFALCEERSIPASTVRVWSMRRDP